MDEFPGFIEGSFEVHRPWYQQRRFKKWLMGGVGLIMVGLVGLAVWEAYSYYTLAAITQHATAVQDVFVKQTIKEVSKHVILPDNATPKYIFVTTTNIDEVKRLSDLVQPGDVALLYVQVHKAYVYRPGDDRVVDIVSIVGE